MTRVALPGRVYVVGACAALFLLLAQVVGQSYVRLGQHWYGSDIPLHMRLSLGSSSKWSNAAVDALRAWNDAGARFQFRWGRYSSGALSCGSPNGQRDVIFSSRHCDGLSWGSVVGIASSWFRGDQLIDADVVFNINRSWDVYYGGHRGAVDFRRVAMHEFGHVLGLDHPDDHGQVRTSIMNANVSDVDRLQTDDINGIRAIYGSDRPRGAPDLVVQSLRTSPDPLTAGQTFTLSATVRNVGSGTAATTTLRYLYYRSSSREWVVVGTDSVSSLAASASSPESIRLPAPAGAGTHVYSACVTAVAGEIDRDNCSDNLRVTVTGGGSGAPDLVVESLRTSPGTLAAGRTFTLSATVRNIGSGAAAATTLRYYQYDSDSRDWEQVGTDSVGSLSASASSPESIRLTAPSRAGTHYFNACVTSVAGEIDREKLLRQPAGDGDGGRRRRAGSGGRVAADEPGDADGGRNLHLVGDGAEHRGRDGGGDDAPLPLLPRQQQGVGGGRSGRRRQPVAVGKQRRVDSPDGPVEHRDALAQRVRRLGGGGDQPGELLRQSPGDRSRGQLNEAAALICRTVTGESSEV